MYQFRTYKIGSATGKGGWYWQVTKDFGPIELVIARSGISYMSEEDATEGYKEMVKWACGVSTPPAAA
jgi:hypothetical protein